MSRDKIILYLLVILSVASVLSLVYNFRIVGNIIVKGERIVNYTPSIVDLVMFPNVNSSNISVVKAKLEKIPQGYVIKGITFKDDLSAMVLAIKVSSKTNSFEISVNITPKDEELSANPTIILATSSSEYQNSPWTAEELLSTIYNRTITLKYLNDNRSKDFYVLDFNFCKYSERYCSLKYKVSSKHTSWYNIIIASDGSGNTVKWRLEIFIT